MYLVDVICFILKFYHIIICLKDHKLAKSCNFRLPRRKEKNQNYPIFFKNSSFTS